MKGRLLSEAGIIIFPGELVVNESSGRVILEFKGEKSEKLPYFLFVLSYFLNLQIAHAGEDQCQTDTDCGVGFVVKMSMEIFTLLTRVLITNSKNT